MKVFIFLLLTILFIYTVQETPNVINLVNSDSPNNNGTASPYPAPTSVSDVGFVFITLTFIGGFFLIVGGITLYTALKQNIKEKLQAYVIENYPALDKSVFQETTNDEEVIITFK